MRWTLGWLCFSTLACSTGTPDDGPCLASVTTECQPLYAPNYDEVFNRTLKPTCALAGGACHAADGAMGGLVFADADDAFDLLLDGRRVLPGDPACSVLIKRLVLGEMPPGKPLSAAEQCAIVQWVAGGAKR